jgi:hypothetical protein
MPSPDSALEIDDAIVLLLGAPARVQPLVGRLQGITRLEKLIFLMERETSAKRWLTEEADFDPYNFGPFSSKVYQAVDMLGAAQIISDSGANSDSTDETWEQANVIGEARGSDPYVTRDFELTERGWRYYQALLKRLPDGALEELTEFKNRFASLPLRQLVRYVYQRYEEFTSRSLIKDDILGR